MNGKLNNLITYGKEVSSGFRKIRAIRFSSIRKAFSLMGKREKITLLVFFTVALLSFFWSFRNFYYAHTKPAPGYGGNIQEGLLGQPTYINPLLAHQEPDMSLIKLVFSGLYKYDNSGNLIPDLAEEMPQISQDQKQYTIKLKKNVKWHNDKTLTADDVVFTIQTLKDPSFKSPYRSLWQYTKVEKLSDYEVKFTTDDISGPFIYNLTFPILPKYVWGNVQSQNFLLSKNNLEAIGTGPYAISEIKKLQSGKVQSITLKSNSNYFAGKPKIDTIIFRFYDTQEELQNAFRGNEISALGETAFSGGSLLDPSPDSQAVKMALPWYQVVFFNLNNSLLSDIKLRQALSLATDKKKIINDVFKNQALLPSSPLLFSHQISDPKNDNVNLEQAKKILTDSGWAMRPASNIRTKKNQQFTLTISTNDSEINSKAASNLADQWKSALDINVNLNILPTKDLTDKNIRTRNFDILLMTQKFNADPDPFVFWHSSQVKDPGYNLTGYSNPDADKLIVEARSTTDQKVRMEKYKQFDQMITQSDSVIFLDQAEYSYIVSKDIKNISLETIFDPSQRLQDLPAWYINEKRVWK